MSSRTTVYYSLYRLPGRTFPIYDGSVALAGSPGSTSTPSHPGLNDRGGYRVVTPERLSYTLGSTIIAVEYAVLTA
jgi:hypothetical protein